jgi:hypothetical protein
MILDRLSILAASDLATTDVEVPEWGGTVRVRALTGTAREAFGRSLIGPDGKSSTVGYTAKLIAVSVVGEDGKPLFTMDDLEVLGDKCAPALERIADAAESLNKMKAGAIEEAQGN